MRRITLAGVVAVGLLAFVSTAHAQLGIGIRAGTTGVGGELSYGFGKLALRAGAGVIPYDPNQTVTDLEYDVKLPGPIITAGLDFYITENIHLSGGLLTGIKETELEGRYTGSSTSRATIGDNQYTAAQVGTLSGTFETSSVAPFVGLGFGSHLSKGIGFTIDLGAAFMKTPTLNLISTGGTSSGTQLNNDLRKEADQLIDKFEKYTKLFPILNIGLKVGFGK